MPKRLIALMELKAKRLKEPDFINKDIIADLKSWNPTRVQRTINVICILVENGYFGLASICPHCKDAGDCTHCAWNTHVDGCGAGSVFSRHKGARAASEVISKEEVLSCPNVS